MRKEIECKKRRGYRGKGKVKKVESNRDDEVAWEGRERESLAVWWCVLALFQLSAAVFIKVSEF